MHPPSRPDRVQAPARAYLNHTCSPTRRVPRGIVAGAGRRRAHRDRSQLRAGAEPGRAGAFFALTGIVRPTRSRRLARLLPSYRHQTIPINVECPVAGAAAVADRRQRRRLNGDTERPAVRNRADRRRALQGLRAVHPGVPAEGARDVGRGERDRLPLSRAEGRLHRLRAVRRDLPRLLLRRVSQREARRRSTSRGGSRSVQQATSDATGGGRRAFLEGATLHRRGRDPGRLPLYCGYPMTPRPRCSSMARRMPQVGGVCINARPRSRASTWSGARPAPACAR